VFHVRVLSSRRLCRPRLRDILALALAVVVSRLVGWGAHGLGWCRLRLRDWSLCRCRGCGLRCRCRLIVVTGIVLAHSPRQHFSGASRSRVGVRALTDRRRCRPQSSRRP
jgi:hypothetical protein